MTTQITSATFASLSQAAQQIVTRHPYFKGLQGDKLTIAFNDFLENVTTVAPDSEDVDDAPFIKAQTLMKSLGSDAANSSAKATKFFEKNLAEILNAAMDGEEDEDEPSEKAQPTAKLQAFVLHIIDREADYYDGGHRVTVRFVNGRYKGLSTTFLISYGQTVFAKYLFGYEGKPAENGRRAVKPVEQDVKRSVMRVMGAYAPVGVTPIRRELDENSQAVWVEYEPNNPSIPQFSIDASTIVLQTVSEAKEQVELEALFAE